MKEKPEVVQFVDLPDLEEPDEAEQEAHQEAAEDGEEAQGHRCSFSFSSPTISFSVDAVAASAEEAFRVHSALKLLWAEVIERQ